MLGLEKAEEPQIKLTTSNGSQDKQENSRRAFTSVSLTMWKPLTFTLTMWKPLISNCEKFLKEMGIPDYLTCLLRSLYTSQEAKVRTRHRTTEWFQIGKRAWQTVYCHPAYLSSMQSTSCEMLGWMKHKLESRLPGEASINSETQVTPPDRRKQRGA